MYISNNMTIVCKSCNEKRAHRDAVTYDDYSVCAPCITFYENSTGRKNKKSLKNCDVYTLRVRNPIQLQDSLEEWNKAIELDKFLVVVYDVEYVFHDWDSSNFEILNTLMHQSKKSFKGLSKEMKDAIMRRHTNFEVQNFKHYKEYIKRYRRMHKF